MNHIVLGNPITSLPRGYATIHEAEVDFINWLEDTGWNAPTTSHHFVVLQSPSLHWEGSKGLVNSPRVPLRTLVFLGICHLIFHNASSLYLPSSQLLYCFFQFKTLFLFMLPISATHSHASFHKQQHLFKPWPYIRSVQRANCKEETNHQLYRQLRRWRSYSCQKQFNLLLSIFLSLSPFSPLLA